MTVISSGGAGAVNSFGERESFAVESIFKSHKNACLVIVSNSLDTKSGRRILKRFADRKFRVAVVNPDFAAVFKDTPAESWFKELKKGNVRPGEVSLGQNLSNLLRLALLYKFGGIYVDTDVVVLRSFAGLRNSIGAQTVDSESGKWSRLNNAVLVFDRKHPLIFKFIEEFTRTFNGNKWGHNGPYMVSRVVSRVSAARGANRLDFSVLPPSAFYPVDWSRIHGLFRGPRDRVHSKWIREKVGQIKKESYAVHLWNRQSRDVKIEDGSVISRLLEDCCCNLCSNSSSSSLRLGRKK
ncbi:Lactosylceramide 4-alpha-galactosyltransferase [Linum grandiflorum]